MHPKQRIDTHTHIQNKLNIGCECPNVSGWQFLLTDVNTSWRRITSPPRSTSWATLVTGSSTLFVVGHARCSSHWTRDLYHRWPCVQFNCSSCVEQFANSSAVFWVTGHCLTPYENGTVRTLLILTVCLSNYGILRLCDSFHFPCSFLLWLQPWSLLTTMLLWHSC